MDRSATDTIRGYFYQFDYAILNLLNLKDKEDSIEIECIEDIDIYTATESTAVQCKYYSKSEYNHSVIKEPIMYMLTHFAAAKAGKTPSIKYFLSGHYKSGQDKLQLPIDIVFLKQNFLTYVKTEETNGVKKKITHYHHLELGLDDTDLLTFIGQLNIDINGQDFEEQYKSIIKELASIFGCSEFSAEYFFYNNALRVIKDLSSRLSKTDRKITKETFLVEIDKQAILFNEWFIQIKGIKAHWSALKKEYFTALNVSPFERFFLIDTNYEIHDQNELAEIVHIIAKKYSKLSQRETTPFCPYVYFHGLSIEELVKLKVQLSNEGLYINDGHPFLGSGFSTDTILKPASFQNSIKVKVLSTTDNIEMTLHKISKKKEVYQFYLTKPYFDTTIQNIHHIKIQISKPLEIKNII